MKKKQVSQWAKTITEEIHMTNKHGKCSTHDKREKT